MKSLVNLPNTESRFKKPKALSVSWNDELRSILIDSCIREINLGSATDSGFKSDGWKSIMDNFNSVSGLSFNIQQIQSQHSDLRKKYKNWSAIKNNSGFGWDEVNKVFSAGEDVWQRFLLAHPESKFYRNHPLPNCDKLAFIFDGRIATGKYADGDGNRASNISHTSDSSFQQPTMSPLSDEQRQIFLKQEVDFIGSSQNEAQRSDTSVIFLDRENKESKPTTRKRRRSLAANGTAEDTVNHQQSEENLTNILGRLADLAENLQPPSSPPILPPQLIPAEERAQKRFGNELSAGFTVAERLKVKLHLGEEKPARIFLQLDQEEAILYVHEFLKH